MRVLVLSDSHGRAGLLYEAVEAEPTAAAVIFLGDGLREAEEVELAYPDRRFFLVCGNCDMGALSVGAVREERLGGVPFLMTHGHLFHVKTDIGALKREALARGAQVVLYGHTHVPDTRYENGLYLLNPGSIAHRGTYGVVDIEAGRIRIGTQVLPS
jgi:putative phosphoesterase